MVRRLVSGWQEAVRCEERQGLAKESYWRTLTERALAVMKQMMAYCQPEADLSLYVYNLTRRARFIRPARFICLKIRYWLDKTRDSLETIESEYLK